MSEDIVRIATKYFDACRERGELPEIPRPLPRDSVSCILGADYDIFRPILESKISDHEKIGQLDELLKYSKSLGNAIFTSKICAVIACLYRRKGWNPLQTPKY